MAGTATRLAVAWRRLNAVGIGDSRLRSASRPSPPLASPEANGERVVIRWNAILAAAAQMLGGTEPVYTSERADGLVQSRVCFDIPLAGGRSIIEHVNVYGIRCSEVWEAESAAAALALGQLERGPIHTRIMDVSRLRCEELERISSCYLVMAGEVYRGVSLLLSDWEDAMLKVETCYKGMYEEAVANARCGADDIYGEVLCDAADRIYELNRASYLKFRELSAASEDIKAAKWDVCARMENHFHRRSHEKPEIRQGGFPHEINVSMKAVLDEMIRSLGWDQPTFKFSRTGTNTHACEAVLLTKRGDGAACREATAIASGEGPSEGEALESACRAAVLLLDTGMRIRLVDVHYNIRLNAELYGFEAKEILNMAISMGIKILAEWENLVDQLQACKEHGWMAVAEHAEKEPWNQVYNAKCECAGALGDLHGACLSDLVLAKDRHRLLSSWVNQ